MLALRMRPVCSSLPKNIKITLEGKNATCRLHRKLPSEYIITHVARQGPPSGLRAFVRFSSEPVFVVKFRMMICSLSYCTSIIHVSSLLIPKV